MVTTRITSDYIAADLTLSPAVECALQELSNSPERVGVPINLFHQATAEALDEIIPPPVEPKRMRRRSQRQRKIYIKASGCGIVKGCLSLAIPPEQLASAYVRVATVQQELPFCETEDGRHLAGLAILAIKSLADLAAKMGMSYAQTQQLVTLLIILGFMKRFRSGRRFLYGIPLGPYAPDPSPEVVREKLVALLQKLDLEEKSPSKSAQEKRARFRRLVEMVKLRYEVHYGIAPDMQAALELQRDPECLEALREIQAVLPAGVRASAMPEITRIIVSRLSGRKSKGIYGDNQTHFSLEQVVEGNVMDVSAANLPARCVRFPEEALDTHGAGNQTDEGLAHDFQVTQDVPATVTSGGRKQKRTKRKTVEQAPQQNGGLWAGASGFDDEQDESERSLTEVLGTHAGTVLGSERRVPEEITSADLFDERWDEECATSESRSEVDEATLVEQSQVLALILEEDWNIVEDESRKKIRVSWIEVEERGKKVRRSCADPDTKLLKAGCHKETLTDTPMQIAKAAFVYTLCQARQGKIRTTRAAFFTSMCRIWREHNTYEAACKVNNATWGQKTPKGQGIPKFVRTIMNLFGHCSYTDIEIIINRCSDEELMRLAKDGVPPEFAWGVSSLADQQGTCSGRNEWLMSLQTSSRPSRVEVGMTYDGAQLLISRMRTEMPSAQIGGIRDLGNKTYVVGISVRGRSWEVSSEEMWNQYVANVRYIRQMKEQLKERRSC